MNLGASAARRFGDIAEYLKVKDKQNLTKPLERTDVNLRQDRGSFKSCLVQKFYIR
jgi:hypothetical protein